MINDISNLSNLTRVEENLDLSQNRLINVDSLSNLTYVGNELSLHTNGSLVDISGLSNIAFAERIELDSPEQYLTVMEATSPFCQALARQDVKVYLGNTNEKIQMRFLCKDSNDTDLWLNLFHTYDQLLNFTLMNEWESIDEIGDLSNKNFTMLDIPNSPLETTSVYDLLLSDNSITNLNFMSNITEVRGTLDISNNLLNNISGLSNVINYKNLYLGNNSINDVSAIDNIQTGLVNLDLSFNDIIRVPNLTNFTDLNNVYFNNNINLEDISGLNSLRNINILNLQNTKVSDLANIKDMVSLNQLLLDNPSEYSPKLDYFTPFCDGIKNDIIFPYYNSDLIDIRNLCQGFTDDYLWLLFFRDNGQMVDYNDISEWETNNGIAKVINKSLQNVDLPPNLIGVNSLFTLNFSDNFLDNVDFLAEVNEVRETLDLSNNSLTDISGLTNLSSIKNLYLQNNENLGDISSLNNIITINDLNISNTGRIDFSGLDSLTTITGTFDIRNNFDLTNLSFLNQITNANAIQISDPNLYDKLDFNTNAICQNINNGSVALYNNNQRLSADKICNNSPSEFVWLQFLKTFDKQNDFENYYSLQQWNTEETVADLSSLNLLQTDLPQGDLGVPSIWSIDISQNELTNVDFLLNTNEVRNDLILNDNLITSLQGMQNITSLQGLTDLTNNKLKNVDGLNNLTEFGNTYHAPGAGGRTFGGTPGVISTNFDLRNNELENINGLSSLSRMRYSNLYINNNPTLTDISGISNLENIDNFTHTHWRLGDGRYISYSFSHRYYMFVDEPNQYIIKPEINSIFCQAVINKDVNVRLGNDTSVIVTPAEMCNVTDEWLSFFHNYEQILWKVEPSLIDSENLTIVVSDNNIDNTILPTVDFSFTTPYIIDMSNNNIDNIDFMNTLTDVRQSLNISGNTLDNLNGLSNLLNAKSLDVSNNVNLIDITGLSKLEKGTVYFDAPTQYINRPLLDSAFCQAILSGDVIANVIDENQNQIRVTEFEMCDSSEAWLQFLKDNGQALDLSVLSELNNQETPIDLSNNNFVDSDLPLGALNIANLLNFDISNNTLTTIRFLQGLSNLSSDLNVSNNNLTNLIGLENLNISGNIYINNNNLNDITSINNLTTINGVFDISNNQSLNNLTGIENINIISGNILIDDPSQYNIKPDVSSAFCEAVANDAFQVIIKESGRIIDVNEICSTTDEWLSYFFENNILLDNLTLEDWNTKNITIDLSNNEIIDQDLPQSLISINNLYNFNLGNNNLTHIDFIGNVESVNNLNLESNLLQNVNGLSNLNTVNESLNLQGNLELTDITGLGNLNNGEILLNNYEQYIDKPNVSTPFCVEVIKNQNSTIGLGEDEVMFKVGEICSSTNPWMTYFYDNNQMLEYAYINDLETNDIELDFSGNNIDNSSIPSDLLNVSSIYKINFSNNNITNINFFGGLDNIRDTLDLSLNNLPNLNGLFSLTKANNLFLNGNNLTDISGLVNLQELTGYLYLNSNPSLTNISYIENIQRNNASFPIYIDNPSQYTVKPDINSNLCLAMDSGSVTIINADNGSNVTVSELCDTGGLTIREDGFVEGIDTDYTLFDNSKVIRVGDKKYFEWEYETGGNPTTQLGIGFSSNPSSHKNNWIGYYDNAFAYWGYGWQGDVDTTSNPIIDNDSNPVMGMAIDYSKPQMEISIYVNGKLQYTKKYTGSNVDLYLGVSRYYNGTPPHRIIDSSNINYLPAGFSTF